MIGVVAVVCGVGGQRHRQHRALHQSEAHTALILGELGQIVTMVGGILVIQQRIRELHDHKHPDKPA